MKTFSLADENATKHLAQQLAKHATAPLIFFLAGNLGAGKTTFARYFLQALDIKEKIKSPTFTIVETYHSNLGLVFHFDLYRIHDPEELEYIGFEDYLQQDALCLFEWPEHAGDLLPSADLTLELQTLPQDVNARLITLNANTTVGNKILAEINEKNYS